MRSSLVQFANALGSRIVRPSGKTISVSRQHPEKAPSPIEVNEADKVTVSTSVPLNTPPVINRTPSGITRSAGHFPFNASTQSSLMTSPSSGSSAEHPQKAVEPICRTLLGILINRKFEHPPNASLPIERNPSCSLTDKRLLQLLNALEPMSVTLAGIVIERRLSHP